MKALGILKEPYSAMPKDGGGFIFSYTSKEIQEAIAELEALQAKPPCCVFNDGNIKYCDGCDWVNECVYHNYYEPKQITGDKNV